MRINIDDADIDDGSHYWYRGELFTGEIIETDRDGNILVSKPVVRGRENGTEREWYSDGTMHREIQLVDGRAVGTGRVWHRNGRLAEEREFDDRNHLLALRRWDQEGKLLESKQYNRGGDG